MKNVIAVHTKKVRFATAPELYGLFFEDINHAADGGLYPEMIRNRAFEDSLVPEGCTTDPNKRIFVTEYQWPGAFNHGEGMDEWAAAVEPTEIPGWYAQNARMDLLTDGTLNRNRKAALQVCFAPGGKIYNIGYCGIPVREGDNYRFYFMVKSSCDAVILISLEAADAKPLAVTELCVKESKEYTRYDCTMTAAGTDYKGRISISAQTECDMVIGFTSLMPEKTFKGHGLREDLAMALKQTHARFIRFPGGCVVEGINEQNSMRFSRTIGPVWERPSVQLMWHYRATNGLGFHEYLQLCEDLEMEAMYVCNCGMSCQARHGSGFSDEITQEYLQEALHALEYALGSEETEFGRLRALNGRKEPFKLKYVEIGNENWGEEYFQRYERFYKVLKEAYPQVIYISNAHTERRDLPTEYADEHYYDAPEFFLENGDMFDSYDRNGPKIFLGEYAVNGGNTIASMECALAEAVFLLGVENNQDIVRLTAYAPLFQNADYTAWKPNLIVFDNHQVYGIPSYHAISLLGKYRGDEVIEIVNQTEKKPPVYRGVPGIMCEKEGLLFRNARVNGRPVEISKCVYGEAVQDGDAYRMIYGTKKHHFTGKSQEWNEAFEEFITGKGTRETPMIWTVFGEEELEEYTFEIEVKAEYDNPITFSVWNHHPETDAGCNEPKDSEWTLRTVRSQVWKIADGVGATRVPRFFDPPLTQDEQTAVDIDYGKYNRFKIVCDHYGDTCYINDRPVQKRLHPLHPLISAAASQDEEYVYLKVVNVDGNESELNITLDCEVEEEAVAEVLCAKLQDVNSFEEKQNVACVVSMVCCGSEFGYRVPPYSVNVLKIRKR